MRAFKRWFLETSFWNIYVLCLIFLAACFILGGCTTPRPADVRVQCLPLKEYSAEWQKAFAVELSEFEGLRAFGKEPGALSHITDALIDYEAMRDADRACLSATRTQ